MFDAQALRGFIRQIPVDTRTMNDAQSVALLTRTAVAARDRVIAESRARSGRVPAYRQVVDGAVGVPFDAVRPDGTIVLAWQYLAEIADDTLEALRNRSPRVSGEYIASFATMVDGVEADLSTINVDTAEVKIVATAPYSRRLEVGKRRDGSPFVVQVKPHIVEETAIVARKLFGSLAAITYGYVDITDAYRLRTSASHRRRRGRLITTVEYPAITITPRIA